MQVAISPFSALPVSILPDPSNPAGYKRSSKWDELRDAFIKDNATCALCRTRKSLQVHHVIPFHVDPSKELDWNNLLTLCHVHHLAIGHLWRWDWWNPRVREHVTLLSAELVLARAREEL